MPSGRRYTGMPIMVMWSDVCPAPVTTIALSQAPVQHVGIKSNPVRSEFA